MRILVIGNGAIGTMTALSIAREKPNWEIAIIGPTRRTLSASVAAGAMANVFAEYESVPDSQESAEKKFLETGIRGSQGWRDFLKSTSGLNVIQAEDTLVALKKGASGFEADNFQSVADIAASFKVAKMESSSSLPELLGDKHTGFEAALRIVGEFGFDTQLLFKHLDRLLRGSSIKTIDDTADSIDFQSRTVHSKSGQAIGYDQCVIAAGANSSELLSELNIMPMFAGVGTALRVRSAKNVPRLKTVIRTVNRGGAQCGVHLVPLANNGIYVGAGNRVTLAPVSNVDIRFETVRYLLNSAQDEFLGSSWAYEAEGEVVTGLRPRTLDGHPLFGPLDSFPEVVVATGTNRVGLTWAPAWAQQIAEYFISGSLNFFESWLPQRSPITYAPKDEALHYFSNSRVSAALEHRTIENSHDAIKQKYEEISNFGVKTLFEIEKSFGNFVPNPDNWTALVARDSETT